MSHGWTPERQFLPYRWDTGYSEAAILYVLALGSPTFPIDPKGYIDWTSTFEWMTLYDIAHAYAGPLFIHQLSQLWLDLRGIHDDFNTKVGIDYFENSRRATHVQRQYGRSKTRWASRTTISTAGDSPRATGQAPPCSRSTASVANSSTTSRRAILPRRWHARAVGGHDLPALCAGDRLRSRRRRPPPWSP